MFELCDLNFTEALNAMLNASFDFYERSPLVASTGFLSLFCSIPLALILNFALNIKSVDNEAVRIRLEHEFSMESLKFNGDK
ncbi:hypothetical protein N4G41_03685 [Kosakonia sacchari]|uniref:hypothetical protein n=1 Tax=Kosakonia sacchari TaxID=1158459 RepID=UPI002ACE5139|nr:hypothetical protein [Kosakonia sacchari]MDZ7320730.1 hypothetical protein [Kosakonia sacchari]